MPALAQLCCRQEWRLAAGMTAHWRIKPSAARSPLMPMAAQPRAHGLGWACTVSSSSVIFLRDGDVFAHGGLRARRHKGVVVPSQPHPQRGDACVWGRGASRRQHCFATQHSGEAAAAAAAAGEAGPSTVRDACSRTTRAGVQSRVRSRAHIQLLSAAGTRCCINLPRPGSSAAGAYPPRSWAAARWPGPAS